LKIRELRQQKSKKTASGDEGKQEEEEAPKQQQIEKGLPINFVNETAQYELFAVLTHKGRIADSGHYVSWVKESEDKWAKYDDDQVSYCNNEEIKKLSGKGGGDWHMAYLIVYRTKKV